MYHQRKSNMVSRFLFSALLATAMIANFAACSEEAPSVTVRNDFTAGVNVQLKPAAGSTININSVPAGQSSSPIDIQEGQWTATASVQGSQAAPSASFNALNDNVYTLVITNSEPPEMQLTVQGR
jgi:hypothetical protein